MSEHGLLFVFFAALLTVTSNLTLRAGVVRAGGFIPTVPTLVDDLFKLAKQPLFLTGVVLYSTAALVWFRVISTENLNSSYPILVGCTFLMVTVGATIFFTEPISFVKVIGICLILVGIVVISRT
jgi:multidrug transporter EmrE-like cation transporter